MATGKKISELDSLLSPDGSEYLVVETGSTNKKVLAEDIAALVDTTYSDATTSVSGLMSGADKTKLDGVASNATANSADATLLARANHTGTQSVSTITGLGGAATLSVGTTPGTVAAGDDARFVEVVQSVGSDTAKVMSQKAVTDDLATKAALRATSTVDGGIRMRVSGGTLYITNDGTDA